MAKFASQFKRLKVATNSATPPQFELTFDFSVIDSKNDIEIDHILLMEKLGYADLHAEVAEFTAKHPESMAIVAHIDFEPFMVHLRELNIYDRNFETGFIQHVGTEAVYNGIVA